MDTSTRLIDGDQLAIRLGGALASARPACVVVAEVRGLRVIDELAGTAARSRVVVAIGERLAASLHADDLVAHLGGSTFAIVCFGVTDAALGPVIARRVQDLLGGTIVVCGVPVHLSATAGAAITGRAAAPPRTSRPERSRCTRPDGVRRARR